MGNPWKGTRSRRFRTATGVIACYTSLSLLGTVTAPAARAQEDGSSASSLVSAISDAQARVDALNLEIGSLREAMNQALVDLHDAQSRAEQARRGADAARQRLAESEAAVEVARRELHEVTRSQYRSKGSPSAFGAAAGGSDQKDVLDRSLYLRQQVQEKQAKLDEVERARTAAANEESTLREASELAERSAAEAADAERSTRASYEQSQQEIAAQESERDAARRELSDSQAKLEQTRPKSAQASEGETTEKSESAEPATQGEEGDTGAQSETKQQEVDQEDVSQVRERLAQEAPEASSISDEQITEALTTASSASQNSGDGSSDTVAAAAAIAAAAAVVGSSQADHASMDNPYGSSSSDVIAAFANSLSNALGAPDSGVTVSPEVEEVLPEVDSAESVTDSLTGSDNEEDADSETTSESTTTSKESDSAPASDSAAVETVIARAMSQVGTPYVWGGGDANGPTSGLNGGGQKGFDCSGLVLYAFAAAGVSLPHYTGYQYQRGQQIDPDDAQRGDLLFWGANGDQHVAIYLGDGTMIEAPQSGQNVQVSPVRYSGMSAKAVRLL